MFLAVIIQENLDKQPWIENGQRFAIHLLTSTLYQQSLEANWKLVIML